jgi:hypothetical protein
MRFAWLYIIYEFRETMSIAVAQRQSTRAVHLQQSYVEWPVGGVFL